MYSLFLRIDQHFSIQTFTRIDTVTLCHNKTNWRRRLGVYVNYSAVGRIYCAVSLEDFGDKYESHKARLRLVYAQAVVQACPDVVIVAQAVDERAEQSLRGLRLLATW